ncbi:MAG: hypothetical protein ACRD0E_07470 [Acidimicrobiales bacterium]
MNGKTVNKRLSEREARLYQQWIANDRRARALLSKMRAVLRPENWTSPAGASPVRVIAGEPGSRPRSVAERRRAERGVESLFGGSKRAGRRTTRSESCSLVTFTTGEPSRSCHGEGPRPTYWLVPEMPLVGSPRGTGSGTCAWDGSGQERPVWPASSAKTERISQW